MDKLALQIKETLMGAKRIILATHTDPDGDALGSMVALYAVLRTVFDKEVVMAATGKMPDQLRYLPYYFKIHDGFDPLPDDVAVILDCGGWSRTGLFETDELIIEWPKQVVVIDHHAVQGLTPGIHLIDTQVSSTSELVAGLLQEWGVEFNRDIATALLTGIAFDTGSFRHANTTQRSLALAGELTAKGADLQQIVQPMFLDKSIGQLKLWGTVLSKMQYDQKRQIAVAYLTREEMLAAGVEEDKVSGVVSLMNTVPGLKFCLLLTERADRTVRGSFRTEDDGVNVSALAKLLGGGGHPKASGFSLPVELLRPIEKTVE